MVAAKRSGNQDKLESLGLGEEDMASMRREAAAAAATKRYKAKKKNKSKKKSKEEIGVTSREYPLRNRTTTPVRLSQEAVAEIVQKSEEVSVLFNCCTYDMLIMICSYDVHINSMSILIPPSTRLYIHYQIQNKKGTEEKVAEKKKQQPKKKRVGENTIYYCASPFNFYTI